MSTRTDIFLDKYKTLENVVKTEFRLSDKESPMNFIMNNRDYQNIRNQLDLCRETRNLLSHNPKVSGEYAVEPSEKMIELLDKVIAKITMPPRANNIMIKKSDTCYRGMNDSVREAMFEMHEKSFTHIPLLEDDRVVGVFCENTLLSIIIDEERLNIDSNLKFTDIKKYLDIERKEVEVYPFVSQDTPISKISELFKNSPKRKDRTGMVFVTQNGKKSEKLLGIITAWEVAAEVDDV